MARKLICTIYDIEANIPELYSKDNDEYGESIGLILDKIQSASSEILQNLVQFFGINIEVPQYLTYPIGRKGNSSKNSYLKIPTLLIDSTDKEPDTYIITFSSPTAFIATNFYGDNVGNGDSTSDFTSSDGLFKIQASDWIGNNIVGDKYIFAYQVYEEVLRQLVSYKVADSILAGRYVSEAANVMTGLQRTYKDRADALLEKILVTGEIQLRGQREGYGQPPSSFSKHSGYNVDRLGILRNPLTE